ncbi:dolichyl-phosphate beta-glucosyltransferase [Candidatus Omnitrophota bacterium]
MYLSVVIPAFNEEKRILSTLNKIDTFFREKDYDYEVIVVDDGSADGTMSTVEKSGIPSKGKVRVLSYNGNRGKGYAVKTGILESKGEYVLVSDADMSTPIEEVEKLIGIIEEGYDAVIGSRSVSDSEVRVRQPWYRERMGKTFNLFVRLTLGMNDFIDTQCGFKLFKGDVAREIAGKLQIDGFSFDVEMLYLAKRKGYKIKEVGIIWNNSPQSKVKVIASSTSMFLDLFNIRRIHG